MESMLLSLVQFISNNRCWFLPLVFGVAGVVLAFQIYYFNGEVSEYLRSILRRI